MPRASLSCNVSAAWPSLSFISGLSLLRNDRVYCLILSETNSSVDLLSPRFRVWMRIIQA